MEYVIVVLLFLFLEEKYRFDIKGKVIHFMDYIDELYDLGSEVITKDNRELSICYAGTIRTTEFQTKSDFGNLIDLCEENKCHFHLYALYVSASLYQELLLLE